MKKEELEELINEGLTAKQIAERLNVSRRCVQDNCRRNNLHIPNYQNMKHFNENVFDIINTEEKAYWLGFLYADGYISKNNQIELSLKAEDYNHLIKFCNFISIDTDRIRRKQGKIKDKIYENYRISFRSAPMVKRLTEIGCKNNKSLILEFPDEKLFISKDLITHFIRGYVDGDGCISFTKDGRLAISIIGTFKFLNKIKEYLPEFAESKLITDKRRDNNITRSLKCSHSKADIVLTKLYKNSSIFLERKYSRLAVLLSN